MAGVMTWVRPMFLRVLGPGDPTVPGDMLVDFTTDLQTASIKLDDQVWRTLKLTTGDFLILADELNALGVVKDWDRVVLRGSFIDQEWIDFHKLATWPTDLKVGNHRMFRYPRTEQWYLQSYTGRGWQMEPRDRLSIVDWGVNTQLAKDPSIIFLYDISD